MKPPLFQSFIRLAAASAIAGAAVVALLIGCADQNQSPPIVKSVELPVGSFTTNWRADLPLDGDTITNLYAMEQFLFVYTKSHNVYVLDKEHGNVRHIVHPTDAANHLYAPVVLKEYIVYPTILSLRVYDKKGHFVKEGRPRDIALGTGASGAGSYVFFGGDAIGGGRAVCMDINGSEYQSTSQIWSVLTKGSLAATPAVQQGFVYFGDRKGNVYAVNADSGAPIWPLRMEDTLREEHVFGTDGAIEADIKADDYGVYVASIDSKLYCLDRITGHVKWQFYAEVPLRNAVDVTGSTVYIYVDRRGLIALDKQNTDPKQYNRTPRWVFPDGRGLLGEDDKFAYVHVKDGSVVAVDKATGLPQFTSKGRYAAFARNNKGAIAYVATLDGHVLATTLNLRAGVAGELVMTPTNAGEAGMARAN